MTAGIRFYNVIWNTWHGFSSTTEASHSRRYLSNQIKRGDLQYFDESGRPWEMVKIQEIETPVVEIKWLLDLFTTAGNKRDRELHKEQAAYVLRLVEKCAARVALENGDFIER